MANSDKPFKLRKPTRLNLQQGERTGHLLDVRMELGWRVYELLAKGAPDTGSAKNVLRMLANDEIDPRAHDQSLIVIDAGGKSPLVRVMAEKVINASVVKGHGWAFYKTKEDDSWGFKDLVGESTVQFGTGNVYGFAATNNGPLILRHELPEFNGPVDENEIFRDPTNLFRFDPLFDEYVILCDAMRGHGPVSNAA